MKFIDDLKDLSSFDEKTFNLLINQFNSEPLSTIKGISKFETFCKEHKIDVVSARNLYQILYYIIQSFISTQNIEKGIAEIEKDIINHYLPEPKVENIWKRIKDNLPKLTQFILLIKERELKTLTNKIDEIKLVCDIRPLFDADREHIIKYTFPIIISISDERKESKIVLELEEDDLFELKSEVNRAIRKLKILKENFENE